MRSVLDHNCGRKRISVGLLLVMGIGGMLWLARPAREPGYHGKSLRFWLQSYSLAYDARAANGTNAPTREEANEALRQLGPKAIPTLLEMLRAHDSAWKEVLIRLAEKQQLIRIQSQPA